MAHDPRPLAVILAGGLARRMGGRDKALLLLGGRPLLAHVLARITPQVRAVALNANGDPARFAARSAHWHLPLNVPVLPDTFAGHPGPLAGILAGMLWARAAYPDATDILTVPADTPFLPSDLVARLLAARATNPSASTGHARIGVAASGGHATPVVAHPVVGLWPCDLADDLAAALAAGTRKVADFAATFGVAEALFPNDPFFNVNTPQDLAEAEMQWIPDGLEA